MSDLERRLTDLEARFSFLDDALAETDRILGEQGALLEALREALQSLGKRRSKPRAPRALSLRSSLLRSTA